MSPREHFEEWHKKQYGFIGGFAMWGGQFIYRTSTVRARWEAWQACAEWHATESAKPQREEHQ
jgi:hypothetical protein